MATSLQDLPPFTGHAPDRERPLGGYAAMMGAFTTASAGFAVVLQRSGRAVPERMRLEDLALVAVASQKAARLIAKDRVTSTLRAPFTRFQDDAGPGEVDEAARGTGMRRAVGELLVCPYCLGLWASAGFTAALLLTPRATRWTMAVLAAHAAADALQIAYAKAEQAL
jgi:hypothetical protein